MNTLALPSLLCALAGSAAAATIGPPKVPWEDRKDDRPCVHRETITRGSHSYVVPFKGTVDGGMMRSPVGYSPFEQAWQPNRSVRIENLGKTDVENPRLIVNGRGDWRNLDTIVAEATRGWTAPGDRARAIWEFVRRQRFHACTWDAECSDVIKALNVYGYTLCGDQARVLDDLWRAAGFTTRRGYPVGHVVGEVFYDNAYHLLDSDEHVICLERDNQTIASEDAVVRDHDLIKRTHTYGINHGDNRQTDEFSASLYGYEGERKAAFSKASRHEMKLVLRPDESIEYRWGHSGKQYTAGVPVQKGQPMHDGLGDLLAGWGEAGYANLCNGRLSYRPNLTDPAAQRGIERSENVIFDAKAGQIRAQSPAQPAVVTWRFHCPYVFVGGRASAWVGAGGKVEWRYSADGRAWTALPECSQQAADCVRVSLDQAVSPRGKPSYDFLLQLTIQGPASVNQLEFEQEVQMAPLSLPELSVGENRVAYTDHSTGERQVRVTHEWVERTVWHPPYPPAEAISPRCGAEVQGTQVEFAWTPATDPDGDAIADYQFELSAYSDMRWPLSPNFEKLISRTPFRGKASWKVPYPGLLNPDTTYFWRVRAVNSSGVWGPWSPVFPFQCRAPGVPRDLSLTENGQGWTLSWKPNPKGTPPVAYRVYGSDEQGFTASDTETPVFHGRGFVRTMEEFEAKPAGAPDSGSVKMPSNRITQLGDTRLHVAGSGVSLPNGNKSFYRVVAVDAAGHVSGASDFAEIPRPWVYTQPPPGRVGTPYEYQLKSIRSLGDLRCRVSKKSSYNAAFWDREELSFRAIQLPEGLTLDSATGTIKGVPVHAGDFELEIEVTGNRGRSIQAKQRLNIAL